jgi:catechol 2,3-dioxygenase-like lactoylglutathione lyase family enzyme
VAILGFHHVAISTPDIDRLTTFYCDLFGFERVFDLEWPKGTTAIDEMMALEDTAAKAVMLRTGNSFIEFFEFSSPPPASQLEDRPVNKHGITHLCIAVDDAVAECARLEAMGLRLHCRPAADESALGGTYARDPDGNVIEILEVREADHPIHFANRRLAA